MDSGPAPPPSYSATPEIPNAIFEPLLKIAQLGYEANDIRHYYLTMLRHLRRMGAENAEVAYTLVTPISDRKIPFSVEDDSSSARHTVESCEDHVSPKTVPTGWSWSRSASYEPSIHEQSDLVANSAPPELFDLSPEQLQEPQHVHLQIPQKTPTQASFNERPQSVLMLSANYSPSSSARPQLDVNEINATSAEPVSFAAPSSQWFSPEDFSGSHSLQHPPPQPQPQFIHPWPSMNQAPYQMTMSNTQMPLLVPYPQPQPPHPPHRSYTDSFAEEAMNPFSSGMGLSQLATELYHSPFFPTIDVIPSRKRRKVLKTGVKRIAQSLGNARQASV